MTVYLKQVSGWEASQPEPKKNVQNAALGSVSVYSFSRVPCSKDTADTPIAGICSQAKRTMEKLKYSKFTNKKETKFFVEICSLSGRNV
jgi:hypothetical protein